MRRLAMCNVQRAVCNEVRESGRGAALARNRKDGGYAPAPLRLAATAPGAIAPGTEQGADAE
jgi:hypothetical protein